MVGRQGTARTTKSVGSNSRIASWTAFARAGYSWWTRGVVAIVPSRRFQQWLAKHSYVATWSSFCMAMIIIYLLLTQR